MAAPRALQTMRETVDVLRRIVSGERVETPGPEVAISAYRLQMPSSGPLPVILGPFNPGMTRLAGEIADGVLLAWSPLDELPARIALVHEGAARTGRYPASIEIALYVQAYAGPRVGEALERFRRLVLEYAVRPTHRAAFLGSFPEIDRATAPGTAASGPRRWRSCATRSSTGCSDRRGGDDRRPAEEVGRSRVHVRPLCRASTVRS
jgi:alkanesulfonate monooxygenase SsuD/methylene tetrahydromethanopterin reductase-like flavin-dependent oxidoreductase (luciferase family)